MPTKPKNTPTQLRRPKPLKIDKLDEFVEARSFAEFQPGEMFLVTSNTPDDLDPCGTAKLFDSLNDAVIYAESTAGGNIDKRILCITSSVLVLATDHRADGCRPMDPDDRKRLEARGEAILG